MPGINYNNQLPRGQKPIFALRGRSREYHCIYCDASFIDRKALHLHKVREHRIQVGGAELQNLPFTEDEDPFSQFPDGEQISQLYSDSEIYILEGHKLEDDIYKSFNFPVNGRVTADDITNQMREIYQSEEVDRSYKFNISPGFIMRSTEDGSLRYFKPSGNAYILDDPIAVESRETMEAATRYLQALDPDEMIRSARPNTKYQILYITQLTYHVWMVDFPLGSIKTHEFLPDYIKSNRYIDTSFDDEGFENCCIFVCLAQHRKLKNTKYHSNTSRIKASVKKLLKEWHSYCVQNGIKGYPYSNPNTFPGLQWDHVHHFERAFEIRVNILEMLPDRSVSNRYKSVTNYEDILHMNLFKDHLSLVKNIKLYSRKFKCYHCLAMFKKNYLLMKHEKSCAKMTKYVYPSGSYKVQKTVFEELEEFGIVVPKQDRFYSDFIVYDLEAALIPKKKVTKSGKTKFFQEHKPISCSVASNIEPFREPKCIISSDPHVLVKGMFEHFDRIRNEINKQAFYKWGLYLQRLEELVSNRFNQLQTTFSSNNIEQEDSNATSKETADDRDIPMSDMEVNEAEDECESKVDDSRRKKFLAFLKRDHHLNNLLRAYKRFYLYINRCVILSFNGQKYDVHLISSYMIKYFLNKKEEGKEKPVDSLDTPVTQEHATADASQNTAFQELNQLHQHTVDESDAQIGEEETLLDYMDIDFESDADSDTSSVYESDDYSDSESDHSDSDQSLDEEDYMELLGGGGGAGGDEDSILDEWSVSTQDILQACQMQEAGDLSVLKRNNCYVYFGNNEFIMLDVTNWLSPGSSYSKFLAAYGVQEKKFYFPYQSLVSAQSLDEWIPNYEAVGWQNSLRNNEHLMEQEHLNWERNGRKGQEPKTGKEKYKIFKEVCEKENLKTIRQLLEYYNNLDTYPFVKGVENMLKEYAKMDLDIFKVSFGTPGLARIMLMRSAQKSQSFFPLFDKKNSDLYFLFKSMSIGGPSIISTRKSEIGKTYLRADNKEKVSSIYGHDCNSMYLHELTSKLPSTMYVRRRAQNDFKPEYKRNYLKMLVWLELVQKETGYFVRSKASNGHESKFMGYYLDGLIIKKDGSLIALEFLGW